MLTPVKELLKNYLLMNKFDFNSKKQTIWKDENVCVYRPCDN